MSTAATNIFRTIASSAIPGGAGSAQPGKADAWVKIQQQASGKLLDYSLFLPQPTSKATKVIQVHDSGVALSSSASKPAPPTGQESVDEEWEVVYPDS